MTPPEEMEARYCRTLSMSLSSYSRLLQVVSDQRPDSHTALLDHPKFIKLCKHKSGGVREAWFRVVSTLCTTLPDCVTDRAAVLVPPVLTNLSETDPLAASAVWEATLQILKLIPTAWDHVKPQKAVFPGLFKHISSGGEHDFRGQGRIC